MEKWVREEVEHRIYKIHRSYSTSNKRYHFNKILELFDEYPELEKYYIINPDLYYYDDRIKERGNVFETFIVREGQNNNTVNGYSVYSDNYYWQLSDEDFGGLYFIGQIGFNPIINMPTYKIKIGQASNIKERMASYRTHNPDFWHNNCSLRVDNDNDKNYLETCAHKAIQKVSISKQPNADEWFFVSKEVYFSLCETCSSEATFLQFIKTGEK